MTDTLCRGLAASDPAAPPREVAARAICRYCPNEMSVAGPDAAVVLAALDELLAMHRWTQDRDGFRVCPNHLPPAQEAA
jgi:hypothetical protein